MSVAQMATGVHTPEPASFVISELPQRDHIAYCVHLLYSDGAVQQIGMSSRSKRGCRQALRNHRGLRHLPERIATPDGARVASVAAIERGGAYMMQRYCHRRADIAFRLGLHPDQVTTRMIFAYERGEMDEGACSVLWVRDYRPMTSSIASGPYTVHPAPVGAYDDEWPGLPNTLITEGSAPSD